MRISDKELQTIKEVFAENDALLMSVRNLLFGLDISKEEKEIITKTFNPEARRIMRKFILPEFDADVPVGYSTDVWMSSVDGIKSNSPETLYPIFQSQEMWISMMEKALKLLENPDGEKVSLKVATQLDPINMYCQILARNNFVSKIEQSLVQIKLWAGQKKETVEETKKRLAKDSTQ